MKDQTGGPVAPHALRTQCLRAFVSGRTLSLLAACLLTVGRSVAAADEPCVAAAVWASPRVVNYRTVIRDTGEHRSEPSFTAFIELPDGSAAEIDQDSITLNGVPALAEPGGVGDANGNGIDDLMVKFDRSALITTDGALGFAGRTRSGSCFAGETTVEIIWCPVERSDYPIEFTTSNMPDESFNGLRAQLDVHRVKPAAGCPTVAALVLEHGLTLPASPVFDLRYEDYSLMEALAKRGVDTFAANHLGFGFSSFIELPELTDGHDPMEDPCNASLPLCNPVVDACSPIAGVCDCPGPPAPGLRIDQQGSTRYLNPNPLNGRCGHQSNTRFQRVTNQVAQLDLVIEDALAKTGVEKVHLLALSAGGAPVGKYLGDVPGAASNKAKVASVIFLDSVGFRGLNGLPEQPTGRLPTWPLGVIDRADMMDNFKLRGTTCRGGDECDPTCPDDPDCASGFTRCPGRVVPAVPDALWAAIQARDPVGAGWGPQPVGLSRYAIVSRFGWNATVAANIRIPALVLHGLKDNIVDPAVSVEIWSSSPLQDPPPTTAGECAPGYAWRTFPAPACRLDNRTLERLDCGSHILMLETCAGEGCVDPHRTVQKRIADWILTGR